MARFNGVSKGWRITAIIGIVLLLAVIGICIASAVIAGQEGIGFFEALGRVFGVVAETGGEVIEEGGDTAGEIVDGAETLARMI